MITKTIDDYLNAVIDKSNTKNDKLAPENYPVFQGAVYYKCVSAKTNWLGIEAIITLPTFYPDKNRYEYFNHTYGKRLRYLDTPSVYVGGSSDHETDIGFAFFYGLINGQVSEEKITFRPFWRTIYEEEGQIKNVYSGTDILKQSFYYYPGDTVKLDLVCLKENELTLRVELLKETKIKPYCDYRKLHENKLLIVEGIKAPGNGIRHSEYKRVNAIDQYHNEGHPTHETEAQALGMVWDDVFLFYEDKGVLKKTPFINKYLKRIHVPDTEKFEIESNNNHEEVNIFAWGRG